VQASQLPDDEVEAKHARSVRGEEVLSLVRPSYHPPGDPPETKWLGALVSSAAAVGRRKRQPLQESSRVTQRARARQQQVRPAQQPPKTQTGRRGGGGGGRRFISESAAELRKVEWPNQRQVLTGTVVVIIACAIVGTYLWLADLALQPFVERLLLGQ
jgi:preprotein translocase subunit SecE